MNEISKEYGTALFTLACEENSKREYADALITVKNIFSKEPEYEVFLASPSVPLSERLLAVQTAFADSVPEHVLSYIQLLCEKGRISCFHESAEQYFALLNASEHISKAKATSVVELTDAEKQKLKEKLEKICKSRVDIEYSIEPSLLGGLTVEIDGKILDGSLRQRLREVKEVMNQ